MRRARRGRPLPRASGRVVKAQRAVHLDHLKPDFLCGWLASERFGPEWKPSVSGVVISYVDPEVLFTVDPEGPGRWREPPYFEDLVRFATDGNVVGIKTYLRIGPQIHEVLPLVAVLAV